MGSASPVDQYIKTPGTFYKNAYQATKTTTRNGSVAIYNPGYYPGYSRGSQDASSRALAVRVGPRLYALPMIGANEPSPA